MVEQSHAAQDKWLNFQRGIDYLRGNGYNGFILIICPWFVGVL